MAFDPHAPPERAGGTSFRAWAYLIAAALLVTAGAALPGRDNDTLNGVRAVLLGAGLLTGAAGIVSRFRSAGWEFESRVTTALQLVAAGGVVLLAYVAAPDAVMVPGVPEARPPILPQRQWDSARLVLSVLAAVTLAGAFLVLLPSVARKAVVGLLVILHFGNILVSITSVPPPNSYPPWLSVQAWAHFYRPYGSFMYLNNAYHFYSPEPGPPTLAWFYVTYDDGSGRWIKIPSRKDSPVPLHYQRLLALTESINNINHNIPPDYNELASRRRIAGKLFDPEIPLPIETPPNVAYQPPEDYSKVMVSAYARYVARHWPHPDDNPDVGVKTVKVYRLIHRIIDAPAMASGMSPNDPTWDLAFFMGEFNPQGKMVDEHDPFLYFLLPIVRDAVPGPDGQPARKPNGEIETVLHNYLEVHATGRPTATEPRP